MRPHWFETSWVRRLRLRTLRLFVLPVTEENGYPCVTRQDPFPGGVVTHGSSFLLVSHESQEVVGEGSILLVPKVTDQVEITPYLQLLVSSIFISRNLLLLSPCKKKKILRSRCLDNPFCSRGWWGQRVKGPFGASRECHRIFFFFRWGRTIKSLTFCQTSSGPTPRVKTVNEILLDISLYFRTSRYH